MYLGGKIVQRPPSCRILSEQVSRTPHFDPQGREPAVSRKCGSDMRTL